MNNINIATIADKNYLPYLKVTLSSLTENTGSYLTVYCILSESVDISFYSFLEQIKCTYSNFDYKIIDYHNRKIEFSSKNHVSPTAYLKINLPSILSFLDTVIYLDSDLLIRSDIKKLWNLFDDTALIQAVWNPGYNYDNFSFDQDLDYQTFNSGVMILNLKKMREDDSEEKLKRFLHEKNSLTSLNDQAAFNAVFQEWGRLPETWNAQYCFFYKKNKNLIKCQKKRNEVLNNPKILHFTSNSKPWLYRNCHPFKKEYMSALKKVEDGYVYPDKSFKSFLQRTIELKKNKLW